MKLQNKEEEQEESFPLSRQQEIVRESLSTSSRRDQVGYGGALKRDQRHTPAALWQLWDLGHVFDES